MVEAKRVASGIAALALVWGLAAAAGALEIDWVEVGEAANACDPQSQGCFGAVDAVYRIARTEVTNAHYAAFLNAVAASGDPHALYNPSMASHGAGFGGILRSGEPGAFVYAPVAGRADHPVNYVSFHDALRFANWLHNGAPQGEPGPGTTEDGAYTLDAGALADNGVARNAGARVAVASEDEWYKAAYYDSASASYTAYPTGSDTPAACAEPGTEPNTANCGNAIGNGALASTSPVGAYPGSASASGTLDQGGNVWEWNETVVEGGDRGLRGGGFPHAPDKLAASLRSHTSPDAESSIMGFRVVSLPEPGLGWLLASGGAALALLRRRRATRGLPRAALLVALLPGAPASAYEPAPEDALLGSVRGGSFVWDFCVDKSDATPVPPDPRTLLQAGTNGGKAVHFNTFWKNCHVDPEAVQEVGPAETCGELRGRFWRGELLLDTGSEAPGGLFTGTDPDSNRLDSTFGAEEYNAVWAVWGGYVTRPEDFDALAAERYGSGFGPSPNPYPLPGEDPNETEGGSGKLPEMFTQLRGGPYGEWTGRITVTCHACHSGTVGGSEPGAGPGLIEGGGSSLADLNLFLRDFLALGYQSSAAVVANLNHTRGRNNASLINLAFAAGGGASPETVPGLFTSGSTADMDTPAWWNMGHRPAKFVDGVFPMDSPRVDAVFYAPTIGIFEDGKTWMRENGPDMNVWIETLKAPEYPYEIDTELAEEGSRIYHEVDMWAPERANPVRRPEGNGSCASCHGAYAPRYVHDPDFLDNPELEGMAGYIVPLDIIGTDPERLLANNEAVQEAGTESFFGYPPTVGTEQDCGPQNRDSLRGDRELGYLAPPLYGVWATAPYLHNGSVPNLWELLEPADRVHIWRRVSTPAPELPPPNTLGSTVMGYDTDLERAFDAEKVGWHYEEIPCQVESATNPSVSPYVNCNPDPEDSTDPLAEQILAALYSNLLLAWNIFFPPPLTEVQMEDRKIFNSWMFAQGNEGHEFNAVLTDDERRALIEYLKTL